MGLSRIIQSLKLKPKEQKHIKLARSSLPPEAITDSPSTDSNAAPNASANGASDASDISDRPGKASSERLWSQADQDLCGRAEPGLMDEFEEQLGGQPLSNLKSVKEAVIQRLSERQNKKWHFTLMGKTHTVRDQAQRLVDLLTFSDSIVKLAVSTQPNAALAWTSLLNAASAQNQALVDGFEAVVVVQRYWATCENIFLSESQQHISRELATKLQNLYSLMLEYQVRAICHLSKGAIKRALKSPENYWGKKLNAIRDCDVTCRNLNDVLWRGEARDSQSVQFRKMDEHRDLQLKALQAAADERQNDKVNNFLRGLTAAAGQYKRGKNINPTRVPGTCEWFVSNEDFCEWRDSQSSNLLWVSAAPGCGKSVLSRTLIDEDYLVTDLTVEVDPSGVYTLRGTSSPVCYFFFKHGDKSREKMTSSLCAILHQLLLGHGTEDLLDRAAEKYACQPTMLEDASEMWKIIEEYVNSWDTGDIICVLDALDECNRESRDEFIQILHDFFGGERKPGQPRLKLLITSRPEYDLRLSFDSFPNSIYLHFDSDDKYEEISRDINLVIDSRVESMFKQRLPLEDQRAISNKLKSKENSTYLWLHLTLEIIRRKPAFYGRLRDIDDFLKSLPATVSDAYETILNRKAMDQEDNARKTRDLLEIVLAATRPLHLDEANFALTMALQKDEFKSYEQFKVSIWPGDFKSVVKDLCSHLINVYDEHLFFIH
ncbi:hypothetical protein H633G_00959 [Metarhizium anisopliae BRIP 53284]|nr:hypothetical protein H633G_00959 [Metarhizium anisopliae BRIP 53284]